MLRAARPTSVLVLLACSALGAAPVTAQARVRLPAPEQVRARADKLLEDLHARGLFSGAVVLSRGEELYARGFGLANRTANAPFTPDTPTDGASIAKTLTSAAIFMLADEGRLTLDDRVTKYVPEYPHVNTLVRDLLSHAAGLPEAEYDYFEGLVPADSVKTTLRFLDVLRTRAVPPEFPRGTRFRYSSLAYDVAALVVERASGRRWPDFLRAEIFEPLGMQHTFLRPARLADWLGIRTLSYRPAGDSSVLHDIFDNEGFYGGSNLYYSARDLDRWSRSFYAQPVLSTRARARGDGVPELRDPVTGVGGRSRLTWLNWYYHPTARRFHYPGALQGFWSSAYRDEDQKYSVIYVSNNSMPQWLRPLLTRALIAIMEARPVSPLVPPQLRQLHTGDLERTSGRYRIPQVGTVALAARAGRVYVRVNNGLEYPTFLLGERLRYVPGLDVWLGFPAVAAAAVPTGAAAQNDNAEIQRILWLSIFAVGEGQRVR